MFFSLEKDRATYSVELKKVSPNIGFPSYDRSRRQRAGGPHRRRDPEPRPGHPGGAGGAAAAGAVRLHAGEVPH